MRAWVIVLAGCAASTPAAIGHKAPQPDGNLGPILTILDRTP